MQIIWLLLSLGKIFPYASSPNYQNVPFITGSTEEIEPAFLGYLGRPVDDVALPEKSLYVYLVFGR